MWLWPFAWAGPSESTLPDDVRDATLDAANAPLGERVERISRTLLERPYIADPLGEGEGHDPEPLVRYDAFDCLTFVEEVVALSLAGAPEGAGPIRTSLRYGNALTYEERHHFMELQWIPTAIERGWLRDTTSEYGPVTHLEKDVGATIWSSWAGRKGFAIEDDALPTGTMELDILSLDAAIEAAADIRPGSILLTVRADRSWKPIWISHVGIVIPGERPTVRHATKMSGGSTRDHGLVWYLEHLRTYEKWPAAGVAVLEPIEYGPRRSRLRTTR